MRIHTNKPFTKKILAIKIPPETAAAADARFCKRRAMIGVAECYCIYFLEESFENRLNQEKEIYFYTPNFFSNLSLALIERPQAG